MVKLIKIVKPVQPIHAPAQEPSENEELTKLAKVWVKLFNPQAPVTQKNADEVVFRRFQGVEFFLNRTSLQWVLYQDHVLSQMVL